MPFAMIASEGRAYRDDPQQFMTSKHGMRRASHSVVGGPYPADLCEAASHIWTNKNNLDTFGTRPKNADSQKPKILVHNDEHPCEELSVVEKSSSHYLGVKPRVRASSLGSVTLLEDLERRYDHGSKLLEKKKNVPEYFTDAHFSDDFLTDAKSIFDMLKKE